MPRVLISLIAASVAIVGCTSNSSSPNNPTVKYLAAKQGTYCTNEGSYLVQGSSGQDSAYNHFNDSSVYSGNRTLVDTEGNTKTSVDYVNFRSGIANDTTQFAEDGAKLYEYFSLNFEVTNFGTLNYGTRWMQIGDQENSSWIGMRDTINGMSIDYNGIPMTVDAVFDITGTKVGTETLTINGSSVQAMHFKLNYTINFTVSSPLGGIPVNPLILPMDYWFVENVGMVKFHQAPAILHLGAPANVNITISGMNKTTTKYMIAS